MRLTVLLSYTASNT